RLYAAGMLEFQLFRDEHGADLQVARRALPPNPLEHLAPMLLPIFRLAGMRELGYVEGRDFDMTYAMADFDADRLPQVTAELVKLAPDVILAGGTLEAVAARKATTTIPIVVAALADPVALGFAMSDARPTGNVTGITPYVKGLPAKQLELAREVVP